MGYYCTTPIFSIPAFENGRLGNILGQDIKEDVSVYFIYCSVRMNLRAKPMDLEFSALAWHWIN